jgi:hypothetical protein
MSLFSFERHNNTGSLVRLEDPFSYFQWSLSLGTSSRSVRQKKHTYKLTLRSCERYSWRISHLNKNLQQYHFACLTVLMLQVVERERCLTPAEDLVISSCRGKVPYDTLSTTWCRHFCFAQCKTCFNVVTLSGTRMTSKIFAWMRNVPHGALVLFLLRKQSEPGSSC